jgi:hypothetical protein
MGERISVKGTQMKTHEAAYSYIPVEPEKYDIKPGKIIFSKTDIENIISENAEYLEPYNTDAVFRNGPIIKLKGVLEYFESIASYGGGRRLNAMLLNKPNTTYKDLEDIMMFCEKQYNNAKKRKGDPR